MDTTHQLDTAVTERAIERELDLVAGAIRMVEAGGAPAITLVGLDFGPAVIAGSSAAALRAGVVLEALWHSEEDRCDIRVKRPAGEDDRG